MNSNVSQTQSHYFEPSRENISFENFTYCEDQDFKGGLKQHLEVSGSRSIIPEVNIYDSVNLDVPSDLLGDRLTESYNSDTSLNSFSKKIGKAKVRETVSESPGMKSPLLEKRKRRRKNMWQPAEDSLLLELVKQNGKNWALIAAKLKDRTGKQVRDRYLNYLRPEINYENFTAEEDNLLLQLHQHYGNRWNKIAKNMNGRTECQVKNRYYTYLKKNIDKSHFEEVSKDSAYQAFEHGFSASPNSYDDLKHLNNTMTMDQIKPIFNEHNSSIQSLIPNNIMTIPQGEISELSLYNHLVNQNNSNHIVNNNNYYVNQVEIHNNTPIYLNNRYINEQTNSESKESLILTSDKCFSNRINTQNMVRNDLSNYDQKTLVSQESNISNTHAHKIQKFVNLMRQKDLIENQYQKVLKEIHEIEQTKN